MEAAVPESVTVVTYKFLHPIHDGKISSPQSIFFVVNKPAPAPAIFDGSI
jgi:hypothetical protein